MEKLKASLDAAYAVADDNAQRAQTNYVNYYNSFSKDKSFTVGEEVLHPDSTNKLEAQWIGPLPILSQVSKYSYQVQMPNCGVRTLHANNLRRFTSRVGCLGVVFEDDCDFGSLEACPVKKDDNFDESIRLLDLSHLDTAKQNQLRTLLTKYKTVFNDKSSA